MTEQEWIRRAQGGDAEAFAALVRLHQEGVYGFCLRMTGRREDALDLTSEAFLRAYRSLAGFDVTQPFRPWLLRIAANLCRDHLRARQQHPAPVKDAVLAHVPDPAPRRPARSSRPTTGPPSGRRWQSCPSPTGPRLPCTTSTNCRTRRSARS